VDPVPRAERPAGLGEAPKPLPAAPRHERPPPHKHVLDHPRGARPPDACLRMDGQASSRRAPRGGVGDGPIAACRRGGPFGAHQGRCGRRGSGRRRPGPGAGPTRTRRHDVVAAARGAPPSCGAATTSLREEHDKGGVAGTNAPAQPKASRRSAAFHLALGLALEFVLARRASCLTRAGRRSVPRRCAEAQGAPHQPLASWLGADRGQAGRLGRPELRELGREPARRTASRTEGAREEVARLNRFDCAFGDWRQADLAAAAARFSI